MLTQPGSCLVGAMTLRGAFNSSLLTASSVKACKNKQFHDSFYPGLRFWNCERRFIVRPHRHKAQTAQSPDAHLKLQCARFIFCRSPTDPSAPARALSALALHLPTPRATG